MKYIKKSNQKRLRIRKIIEEVPMNHRHVLFQLSCAVLIATLFFACSSTPDLGSRDEYFRPVEKIVYLKSESSEAPVVITRNRSASHADETIKDAVIDMLRAQNRRLEDVVQQLNMLTSREVADNSKRSEYFGELLATRDRVSNEMLLEMIRDQNQRLNDVVEQLKVLVQNQQGAHSNLVAQSNADPLQAPPARKSSAPRSALSPKRLDGSLSYGKAIQMYQSRQYEEAITAFEKLVKRGIEPALADNCYFWTGVCYFNLKRSNQAISVFTEVLGYTGSDKAEGAYFMVGQCYEQMGAKKFAKMAFEKLVKEYPRGSLKQVAEKKLALLK